MTSPEQAADARPADISADQEFESVTDLDDEADADVEREGSFGSGQLSTPADQVAHRDIVVVAAEDSFVVDDLDGDLDEDLEGDDLEAADEGATVVALQDNPRDLPADDRRDIPPAAAEQDVPPAASWPDVAAAAERPDLRAAEQDVPPAASWPDVAAANERPDLPAAEQDVPAAEQDVPAAASRHQHGDVSREWHDIQAMFVDDPRGSVQLAAAAADAAVDALVATLHERQTALAPAVGAEGDSGETEHLREALRSYRVFCQNVAALGEQLTELATMTR